MALTYYALTENGWQKRIKPDITRQNYSERFHMQIMSGFIRGGKGPLKRSARKESQFIGVFFRAGCRNCWQAAMTIKGKFVNLGFYAEDKDAALAYDREAIKLGRPTNILKPITA